MKTHFVLSATAASLLASCATDPALAEKKKSVSIGRFGVTRNVAPTPTAPAAPAPAPAPAAPQVVSAPSAPAPVQQTASAARKKQLLPWYHEKDEASTAAAPAPVAAGKPAPAPVPAPEAAPAPQKKPLFQWNPKKKEESTAAVPAPVQESVPAPAPEKKNWFANWGKKKDEQAAPAPQQGATAAVPAPKKKSTVSIGRFGVTRTVSNEEVAAVPAPVQEAAPAPEKKSRFSWFKRKNDTADAPVAVQVQEKPAVTEKKEKQAPKQRVAKADAPVEFKERDKSKPLSDDIRLPNMLDLPEGKDLKSSGSATKKTGKEGAVISRPPVEEKKE